MSPKTHNQRVLVPLADGFEEIEAMTIIDVLRRAGLDVTTAGLKAGSAKGAHGVEVNPDTEIGKVEGDSFDVLVLPGGMPGAANLKSDRRVLDLVRNLHERGKYTAAICAAPMVLAAAGVVSGTPVTCYPGFEKELGDARYREDQRVVRSGKVITSRGPGTALEFALALVEELCGPAKAKELSEGMLVRAG
jgi:4-methyl-5(b-hydroxyethyl)-thiazole monophosphate biosynthesis